MGAIVFKSDCDYPRWSAAVFLPQNLFMLILFLDFYYRSYIKKKPVANGLQNGVNKSHEKQNGTKEHDS
jgi:hypothetical protein